jgi:DNA-binding MarR family transcriptional regulator
MAMTETAFVPKLVAIERKEELPKITLKSRRPAPQVPESSKLSRKDSLAFWHRVTLASVRSDAPDLSARQLAMMMSIYLEAGPHTVRSLAAHLQVTKAAISRATDSLCKLGYIVRKPDPRDKRSVLLARTSKGIHFLSALGDTIQSELP